MKIIFNFLLFLSIFQFSTPLYAQKDLVRLQLQWKHQFQFAGYYIAKEKGYYEHVGLDVEILEFNHNTNITQNLLNKKINYAIGRTSLINQRSQGEEIVLLAAILQSSPLALVSKKSSQIEHVSHFKNKKFTISGNEMHSAVFPLLLSQNIAKDDIRLTTSKNKFEEFIDNKTDIITIYSSNQEFVLQERGIEYNIFHPYEYDFDFYDDILYTTSEEATQHKQRTIDFTKASLQGWEYAFENIEETVDLILKKYNTQNKTKQALLYEANILKSLAMVDNIPLGYISKTKIQRVYDIYNVMGLIDKPIDMNNFILTTPSANETHSKKLYTQEEKNYLEQNPLIKMCNNPNFEPIEFAKHNHLDKISGISIDTLKILEKDLSVRFENVPTNSWIQSQQFLKEKKCDILPSAVRTAAREKYADFTQPYLELPIAIFTAKNAPLVNGIEDIIQYPWSRHKGSALIDVINNKYPENILVQTNSSNEAFQFVNNGTSYFTLATLPVASSYISKYRLDNLQIAGYSDILYPLSIAVRKDKIMLKNILDKGLKNISPAQHKKILEKWINNKAKPLFDSKTIQTIFIVLLILSAFLFYRQFLLKKTNATLKNLVDEKTKELKELNLNLEKRIQTAIKDNREKERILYSQAKMVSMGEMIGNIAHQWRQPLSVISTGVTGMLMQKEFGLLDDEKFEQTCTMINRNTQYLSRTIDDFKNFIKGDRIKKRFILKNNIDSFVHLIEGSLKKENIQLIINVANDIEIVGYENELVQCFINIFNNAKDALSVIKNSEKIIIISALQKENKVILTIQDNAQGIPQNIIHKVFEPYFTTKHKSQGTGLGLNMTYKLIVDGMNGDINVSNTEFIHHSHTYFGANFQITLLLEE